MTVAGVVLSGGQSSRMGQNKSKMKINDQTLLSRAQSLLECAGIDAIYVSGPDGIPDALANAGPLSGLCTSLQYLTDYDSVFFMPVDMPLVNENMVKQLCRQNHHEVVYYAGFFFPLLINNNAQMRMLIEKQLTNRSLAIHQLLSITDSIAVKHDWPQENFLNANTPAQWHEIVTLLNQ